MLRPEGTDPHHVAYTRTRRGKMERIPQKGTVLKERGKIGPQEAKEVLGGKYNKFISDIKVYKEASEQANRLKIEIAKSTRIKEEAMSRMRPLLAKFDNLSKEEQKFITEFEAGGLRHRFMSFPKETYPYSDLFHEAFRRLTPRLQAEVDKLREALKKVTVQERFFEKADSLSAIEQHLKNILRIKEEVLRNMRVVSAGLNKSEKNAFVITEEGIEKARTPGAKDKKKRKSRGASKGALKAKLKMYHDTLVERTGSPRF